MSSGLNIIASLEAISGKYKAILCDVWGVIHNGIAAFPDAVAALAAARERGVAVVLITNAPRPAPGVVAQLDALGVARDSYDRIVTSGDVTRDLIMQGPRRVFYLGPEKDLTLFEGLDVDLVDEFEANAVVCTGPVNDDVETPDDYADQLRRFRSRDLPFICANPDIVVERGDRLIWCAGALARDYGLMGGRSLIAGKPHKPIYDAALNAAGDVLCEPIGPAGALAIGDGMLTDVKGAVQNGIDILYVTGGIHAREYGAGAEPDPELLEAFLDKHGHRPAAVMPRLK